MSLQALSERVEIWRWIARSAQGERCGGRRPEDAPVARERSRAISRGVSVQPPGNDFARGARI